MIVLALASNSSNLLPILSDIVTVSVEQCSILGYAIASHIANVIQEGNIGRMVIVLPLTKVENFYFPFMDSSKYSTMLKISQVQN